MDAGIQQLYKTVTGSNLFDLFVIQQRPGINQILFRFAGRVCADISLAWGEYYACEFRISPDISAEDLLNMLVMKCNIARERLPFISRMEKNAADYDNYAAEYCERYPLLSRAGRLSPHVDCEYSTMTLYVTLGSGMWYFPTSEPFDFTDIEKWLADVAKAALAGEPAPAAPKMQIRSVPSAIDWQNIMEKPPRVEANVARAMCARYHEVMRALAARYPLATKHFPPIVEANLTWSHGISAAHNEKFFAELTYEAIEDYLTELSNIPRSIQ